MGHTHAASEWNRVQIFMQKLRTFLVTVSVGALSACGCPAELRQDLSPTERTLVVGESFTPRTRFLGCLGTEPLDDEITWSASDTTVVRVDAR